MSYLTGGMTAAQELLAAYATAAAAAAPRQAPPAGMVPMRREAGGMISGPGTGRSDSIPGDLDGDAGGVAVSSGEYVIPADVVSAAGEGRSEAGGRILDGMVKKLRAGHVDRLTHLKGPSKGGKGKFLGGIFEGPQAQSETETNYNRQDQDLIHERNRIVEGLTRSTDPSRDLAGESGDTLAARQRIRGLASDGTGYQAALQGGQDLINSSFDPSDPYGDTLISGSMADYDRGTAIARAAQARSASGRGAFGDRRFVAEDSFDVEAARNRGLLGANLREQGIARRTAAARQSAELAGLERGAGYGDAAALGQIGTDVQARRQQEIDAPWTRAERLQGLVRGGTSSTTTQSGGGPSVFGQLAGLATTGVGAYAAFKRDGGMVKGKRHFADGGAVNHSQNSGAKRRKRSGMMTYADGGEVIPPATDTIPPEMFGPSAASLVPGMVSSARDYLPSWAGGLVAPETSQTFPTDPSLLLGFKPSGLPDGAPAQEVAAAAPAPAPAAVASGEPQGMVPLPVSRAAAPARAATPLKPAPSLATEMRALLAPPAAAAEVAPAGLTRADMLSSPEPTGLAQLPPPQPADDAPVEEKAGFLERFATHPLTKIGLRLMASQNPSFLGALGEAGLGTAADIAAERAAARADRRETRADRREGRIEARDVKRLALDEQKARFAMIEALTRVETANQRNATARERLQLERAGKQSLDAYRSARLAQFNAGLGIRQQAVDKAGQGGSKAAPKFDPAKYAKARKLGDLQADAIANQEPDEVARLQKEIDAIGPLYVGEGGMTEPAYPPGFDVLDEVGD